MTLASMGREWYILPKAMNDEWLIFYGKCLVGRYTVRPMDPMGTVDGWKTSHSQPPFGCIKPFKYTME